MVALRMIGAAVLPVILAILFYFLENKTKFGQLKKIYRQIIIGVVYGILACLATQYGIKYEKYMMNVRSAAPLTAGLVFGAPAGIIAGVIGAVYRFVSVYWGVSAYTQVACSVATLLAGLISAGCSKYMYDGKRPSCIYGAFIAAVTEVFHMLLVFITHMDDTYTAFSVVKETAIIMICANAASLFVTLLLLQVFSKEKFFVKKDERPVSKTFSFLLLVSVLICFVITGTFTYYLQDKTSKTEAENTLSTNIYDVECDIILASDADLLTKCQNCADSLNKGTVDKDTAGNRQRVYSYVNTYKVSEVNIVGPDGVIFLSNVDSNIGYDMHKGAKASEFLCLLDGTTTSYVQSLIPTDHDETKLMKYAGYALDYGDGYGKYFVQLGYNSELFAKSIEANIANIATNRHIGQSGYMFILNPKDGSIVSAPLGSVTDESVYDFTQTLETLPDNKVLTYSYETEDYYYMKNTVEGYLIVSVLPVSEVEFSRDMSVYIGLFMQCFVFFILFNLVYLLLKRLIIRNIHKVNNSLTLITEGDLNTKIDIYDNAEFTSLSTDINATVDRLKGYIDEAEKRIDMELAFAKNIQYSVIPSVFPPYPNRNEFDIYAQMDTAKEVGGDFYDFYLLENNRLAFLIADVSGKGIPAAMFMMNAKSIIKSLTESGLEVQEVLTKANEKICATNEAGMFVTAWMGILNLESGVLNFVNAGHNPPLLKRHDGKYEFIKSRHGLVLAGMDGIQYKASEITLEPNDEIFLYTDGATEAINENTEQFGESRLSIALDKCDGLDATSICKYIKSEIDNFVGTADQFDDITLLSLKYLKPTNVQGGTRIVKELNIEATLEHIENVTEFVDAELEAIDCPPKAMMQINIAIDELFSNIARYAYHPEIGNATVQIEVKNDPISVEITFVDEGVPFDPLSRDNPDVTLSAEERDIGGLGIFMVKKTMDGVHYEYKDGKNILTIIKNL